MERQPTLLEELESRQDEVLAQLDELNEKIERLLNEHTGGGRSVAPSREAA